MFQALLLFEVVFLQIFLIVGANDSIYGAGTACTESTPVDCSAVKMANPSATSGVHTIKLMDGPCGEVRGTDTTGTCCVQVYCDMDRFGGGWTVFQKRFDGSENFYRNWREYEDGFGPLSGEFFMGNKFLYSFTGRKRYELLVELDQSDVNCSLYAHYSSFNITDRNKYNLSLGFYKGGTAGDSLERHNNTPFSTYDQDNDRSQINRAAQFKGAWWYGTSHNSNLNGEYFDGCSSAYTRMIWEGSRGYYYSFKGSEMKLRPADYSLQNPKKDSELCPKNYNPSSCPDNACTMSTPVDCSEIKLKNPSASSAIYTIKLMDKSCWKEILGNYGRRRCCVEVYCDMDRFGGGWTVFQKRHNGKVDFWRNWKEYEDGFGSLYHEFFLGNRIIYYFAQNKTYELLVELKGGDVVDQGSGGNQCKLYAHYSSFRLTNRDQYSLSVGSYFNGTAGDALHYQNGAPFSTYDRDNDMTPGNCAARWKGGWWFKKCGKSSNLNGEYSDGCSSADGKGIVWDSGGKHYPLFKGTEMKLRPVGYKLHNQQMDSDLCKQDYVFPECPNESSQVAGTQSVSVTQSVPVKTVDQHRWFLPVLSVILLVAAVLVLGGIILFLWKKLNSERLNSIPWYYENKASSAYTSQQELSA